MKKVEVTRVQKIRETVEIELPYYYKHDVLLDTSSMVIYGRIDEKIHCEITLDEAFQRQTRFSAEVFRNYTRWENLSEYLEFDKSDREEFEGAQNKALNSIRSLLL